MIVIDDKIKCSACGACQNICPKKCINMILDEEGFMYPQVDESQCIDCGLCNKVCPIENKFSRNEKYSCNYYAAYNKQKNVMLDSSSGGIFWLLAKKITNKNGVVYGVELQSNFTVTHNRAETLDECMKFRKSKYLQSSIGDSFRQAKIDLDNGREVLFTGTPCQIAGLYSYLQKEYDNLVTCEVVCHGVPSKIVFDKYIEELNGKINDKAVSICWRDKRFGWSPNRVSIKFKSGEEFISTSRENPYQKGFLNNLYLRPICYECPFAKLPRISDISLADFWGYQGTLAKNNNNEGLSLVIISSDKGQKKFDELKGCCEVEAVSEVYVKQKNRHAHKPPLYNARRQKFFSDLEKHTFIDELSEKYIYPSLPERIYKNLKRIIKSAIMPK